MRRALLSTVLAVAMLVAGLPATAPTAAAADVEYRSATVLVPGAEPGARVRLHEWADGWQLAGSTWTDPERRADVSVVPGRTYTLELAASDTHFHQWWGGAEAPPVRLDDVLTFTAEPVGTPMEVTFAVTPAAAVRGRVSAATPSTPTEVRVTAHVLSDSAGWVAGPSTVVEADGSFSLSGLRPGQRYALRAGSPKHVDAWLGGSTDPIVPDVAALVVAPASGTSTDGYALTLDTLSTVLNLQIRGSGLGGRPRVQLHQVGTGALTRKLSTGDTTQFPDLRPGTYVASVDNDFVDDVHGAVVVDAPPGAWVVATVQVAPVTSTLPAGGGMLLGHAEPGQVLTAGDPVPSGSTPRYWWVSGDRVVSTSRQLTVPASLLGAPLSVTMLATAPGRPSFIETWGPLTVEPALPTTLLQPVTVTGAPVVGSTLRASGASWATRPTAVRYVWLRNGRAIPEATSTAYVLSSADVGARLSVQLSPEWGGRTGPATTSAPTAPVTLRPGLAYTPRVTGTGRAGTNLGIDGLPTHADLTIGWFRDGKVIAGARGSARQVTPADAGARLHVEVTAAHEGHQTVTRRSAPVRMPKLRATVKVALAKKSVTRAAKARATVTVKVPGVSRPTGKIVVKYGKKSKTYTLKARSKGRLVITLPRLAKGKHAITATYRGTSQVAAKKSTKVTLRVS